MSFCEGGVGVGVRNAENAFFILVGGDGTHHPHPRCSLYTPLVETAAPAHPDRLHSTGRARTRAGQVPGQTMQGTAHTPGRWTRCTGLHSIPDRPRRAIGTAGNVSETVQIWTHSNTNDFQHKNMCKTVDINTRMCYHIDNTRACYTTTKQEDKNHEKDR